MTDIVEKIFVDILKTEMELDDDRIWIANQNVVIPQDDELFVIVSVADIKVVGNISYSEPTDSGMNEIQETVQRENVQIDIMSRNNEARNRRIEALMSLKSVYAQQKEESEQFKIFRIPTSFINTSYAEGGSTINRYTIIVSTQTHNQQVKSVEYFDTFNTRVDDENTIGETKGLIEIEETA